MKSVLPYNQRILFFDGVCGLCNGYIDFLLPRNNPEKLKFASLQGKTAQMVLPKSLTNDFTTLVFYDRGVVSTRSTAVLRVQSSFPGLWYLVGSLFIVPSFLRDFIYDQVSQNRYKVFGKLESCRLPNKDEKIHFLD